MAMTHEPNRVLHDDAAVQETTEFNSQNSSLAETVASQRSQLGPLPTGLLEPFQPNTARGAITPSTSLSNHSSQENVVNGQRVIEASMPTQSRRDVPHFGSMNHLDAAIEKNREEQASAPRKRSANGEIKRDSSLPMSPVDSNMHKHSRNTSTTSRSSNIGEMSSKLQARLSYAKVKVQHGWENHSISELERMTSNQGSPVSASSYTARGYDTPPANYSPVDHSLPTHIPRQSSANTPPEYIYPSPQRQAAARSSSRPYPNLGPSITTVPVALANQTYESFWQSHSNNALPQSRTTDVRSINGPSLAPPVEFSPRKAAATKQKPPILYIDRQFPGQLPSTPPSKGVALAKMRTPSQQAAVEQDALEGLISMGSPGNSQQSYPSTRALARSPLRGQAAPAMGLNGMINGNSAPSPGPLQEGRAPRELNDAEINKMLDEMPDSSSSDEGDLLERRVAPRVQGL